jgi:hypothetical protein
MADGLLRRVVELRAGRPNDPDGMKTASDVAAYFILEQAQAFRRLLLPRLVHIALVSWLLESMTIVPPAALVTVLLLCGTIGVGFLVF